MRYWLHSCVSWLHFVLKALFREHLVHNFEEQGVGFLSFILSLLICKYNCYLKSIYVENSFLFIISDRCEDTICLIVCTSFCISLWFRCFLVKFWIYWYLSFLVKIIMDVMDLQFFCFNYISSWLLSFIFWLRWQCISLYKVSYVYVVCWIPDLGWSFLCFITRFI